jgi:hypothetical protein
MQRLARVDRLTGFVLFIAAPNSVIRRMRASFVRPRFLYRIYRKLGISARRELAAALAKTY